MKHIAKRRARARRPFPICITPFRKGVANRRNTTASLRQLYHTAQKSQALPAGRACFIFRFLELCVADGTGMQLYVADVAPVKKR